MRRRTWVLWIPTIPYLGFTALLIASKGADRAAGFLYLINGVVLLGGTILSHRVRSVRPAYVSGMSFAVQAAITVVMAFLRIGDLVIVLPINGVICMVFAFLTFLYSASLRASLRNAAERIWVALAYIPAGLPDAKVRYHRIARRCLQAVLGIVLVIDLVITVLPQPTFHPGTYSETEASIQNAKNWADLYLSPVGWYAALFKDTETDTLYQLRRSESWKKAIQVGRYTGFVLLIAGGLLLSPRQRKTG